MVACTGIRLELSLVEPMKLHLPRERQEKEEKQKKDSKRVEREKTHWNPVIASLKCQALTNASGTTGSAIALPTKTSCRAVLIFEISVGLTSAEGSEKSQYRAMVFGSGSEIQR
jgi:hypothetical protein